MGCVCVSVRYYPGLLFFSARGWSEAMHSITARDGNLLRGDFASVCKCEGATVSTPLLILGLLIPVHAVNSPVSFLRVPKSGRFHLSSLHFKTMIDVGYYRD